MRYRYICAALSISILLAGAGAYFYRGGFNYHIDFVGGIEFRVGFEKDLDIAELRSSLSKNGWDDSVIQNLGGTKSQFLIRVKRDEQGLEEEFKAIMKKSLSENPVTVQNVSWVGAEVSSDIKWNSFISILLSLLFILAYMAIIRARYRFAVGAVVALAHDILIILSVFLILNEQISLNVLAALLTTLGYSINDTIVINNSVEQNLRKLKGASEVDIFNISLNQTFRRTMLTSITTFLAVASIYFIGGEALEGFALALLIGIVAGTYSSIYIASTVVLAMGKEGSLRHSVA